MKNYSLKEYDEVYLEALRGAEKPSFGLIQVTEGTILIIKGHAYLNNKEITLEELCSLTRTP